MILHNFYLKIYLVIYIFFIFIFPNYFCKCLNNNEKIKLKDSLESELFNLELYNKKFFLLVYTISLEVITEFEPPKNISTEINIEKIKILSRKIAEDFDKCEEILIGEYLFLNLPFVGDSYIKNDHNLAYEICCRIRMNISTNTEFTKILNGSSNYLDLEDYVKTSINTIDTFEDLSEKPISSIGPIYTSTLEPHRGIVNMKEITKGLEYNQEFLNENNEDKDNVLIFNFDAKVAPFMHCTTHQYIYTYYHHLDNSKCLGLTIRQLELVDIIKSISVNVKNIPRIPLDIACTAVWFISRRWNFCPYAFKVLMKLKKKDSINFCEMVKRKVTEKNKYLTKSLSLSEIYLINRAEKILRYIELVLRLNSRYFENSEITSKDIAKIIYSGESDNLVKEDEELLYNKLKKNILNNKFLNYKKSKNRELAKTNNLRYPIYKRHRDNFTTIFDHIMYSGGEYLEDKNKNIILLPLEFRRSPNWTNDKNLGSTSGEIINRRTVLQSYYIPPPSNFVPNDVSNWITGPCCWLKDNYKHIPALIISISKDHGHNLHILNACEAIFALINDSGDSCANVLLSALFFTHNIGNYAESSDICSETAIRSNLPFYPKKDADLALFLINKNDLTILYEGLIVALCLELGISLEKEDIYQIIFGDYPHNNSLVPRTSLNHLLYRALKLPESFGKSRNFWKWPTQMYTRISNKQAKIILSHRMTQLTLEIAQITNEIEIMNDIIKKNQERFNPSKKLQKKFDLKYKKNKSNYLRHFNYDFELANMNSIELNLSKLERLRYDLIFEKEKIKSYIYSLTKYIGHKIHDIPKELIKNNFVPLYKPKVFKVDLYDNPKLQIGIIASRSVRNLPHLLDNEPIQDVSDEYLPKINYKIKRYYQSVKECSSLTNKGLDLAIFTQNLLLTYLNIDIDASISCRIILNMPPSINIKEAFLHSSYSVLNKMFEYIEINDLEEIWLKIIPIISIPSGDLYQTKLYKFINYSEENDFSQDYSEEVDSEILSLRNSILLDNKYTLNNNNSSLLTNDKFTKYGYKVPQSIKINTLIKKPKKNEEFFDSIEYEVDKFDNFWNKFAYKNPSIEHEKLVKEEYKKLRRKLFDIDKDLIEAYKNISPSNLSEKNYYYRNIVNILEKEKKDIILRIIHLAGNIAETEVKNADLNNILITKNIRRIADLHRINSISHAEILKLKGDDSGRDHNKRIKELESKILDNNLEIYKLVEMEGNDVEDPRWYSDIEKCLSSYIPYRKEVRSVNPSEGFKFYFKYKRFYVDSNENCSKNELIIYKHISKDLKKLFELINIPKVVIQEDKLKVINLNLIDPREMEYWQILYSIMLNDDKKGCNYLKKFMKSIFPIKKVELKEFLGSPVFILWCANHVNSRLGNEDIWRNIVGLIWLIFYSKPFKPKDFIWKNILMM